MKKKITKVKERPIICDDHKSATDLIEFGCKTQVRKLFKWIETNEVPRVGTLFDCKYYSVLNCPYGVVGERLWVRETWKPVAWKDNRKVAIDYKSSPVTINPLVDVPENVDFKELLEKWSYEIDSDGIICDLDGTYSWSQGHIPAPWRSPVSMPRWASRLTLEIVNIRLERWNDVTESEANKCGYDKDGPIGNYVEYLKSPCVYHFANAWDEIHSKKKDCSWSDNPIVWVIDFVKVKP